MEYFGSSWCRNISAVVGAEYSGEYRFVFAIIHAVNTQENGIFRQLLVPKYFGEYWFAFSIKQAVNTHENGVFQQLLVLKDSGEYR